jgi:hypothetical protein
MTLMRWGMLSPPRTGGPPVANIRNTSKRGEEWERQQATKRSSLERHSLAMPVSPFT